MADAADRAGELIERTQPVLACSRVSGWAKGVALFCGADATHRYWRGGLPPRLVCAKCLRNLLEKTLIKDKIMYEPIAR